MRHWLQFIFLLLAASAFSYALMPKPFFQLDAANRLTNTITPTGKETRLTYNNRGFVSTVREPSGQTNINYYDAKGRLTNRVNAVASTRFDYDANDNLTAITNVGQASRLSQTFDAYDRMLSHTYILEVPTRSSGEDASSAYLPREDGILPSFVNSGPWGKDSFHPRVSLKAVTARFTARQPAVPAFPAPVLSSS